MDEKEKERIKEIRRRIIGKGIMAYLKESGSDIHIHYESNEELPPEAR